MSNGTRAAHRAAHRAAPRSATRLTKGALVAVLAGSLTVTAAAARDNGPLHQLVASADEDATAGTSAADRAAATQSSRAQRARAAMVDVAADAIVVADTVGTEGKSTKVDSASLKKLDKAAAKLKTLMSKVGAAAPATTAGGDSDDVSSTATKEGAAASTGATPSSSATAGANGTTSDDAAKTDTAKSDTAKSGVATSETTTSDATDATSSDAASDDATASADEAGTGTSDASTGSQDVAADGPLTSLAESPDMPAPATSDTASSDDTAPTADDGAASADDLVVPAITGAEDSQTLALRTALQQVVDLSSDVEADAAKKKEAAEKKAAAKKAADEKAAQMAAWKKSLLGYPNGQIPASALCALSFDSSARLRCDAAQDLEKLNTAYRKAFGRDLTITDSYRSLAGQISCRATKGSLCATPGTSNHGTGIAVDFGGGIQTSGTAAYAWMVAHAATYDWHHPSWATSTKFEPWHWEYTG
ncbi:D-alanyl-D-alanine carboxypeptidase family protein [Cellulomonas sp. JH27-2]|uniref:M15 family metallopeptidase n=1 Tax=Cellulomonas sp. JH27-2 TaxID=2774139 RepID=UPI00177AEAFC|nr:M15 family metallopeptidase [Cellulomonas sp. JH27-2]MBD8059371.1 D-alanyl-D-alanine carboxypeptidase family protein [Cellulomonas sp. JH27-2]